MRICIVGLLIIAGVGCDSAQRPAPPPLDVGLDAAIIDQGVDAALADAAFDRGLDAAVRVDQMLDAAIDEHIVDALIDAEPFEAGPPPFNLAVTDDPATLGTTVVADWTPALDEQAVLKRIVITVAPPAEGPADVDAPPIDAGVPLDAALDLGPPAPIDPTMALRVPVRLIAPAAGCPCDFIVTHSGFDATDEAVLADPLTRWAIQNRVALVVPGVAPLDESGPDGATFAAALRARLAETGDVRYTAIYIWGLTYIRAATAAIAEAEVFRGGRVGAHGRSRAGIAAATAVIHDPRFTALHAWLTPIAKLPTGAIEAPDGLTGRALRRLRFDAARLALPIKHFDALRQRRVNMFLHNGANDPQTPGLRAAEDQAREFPACIEPSLAHGPIADGGTFAQPLPPQIEATRTALFRATYARGYRLMTPPLISHTIVDDTLTILARFRSTPRGEDGTLWYAVERPEPDAAGYAETRWQSVAMTRFDTRTYVATLPVPAGARWMDVFSYHTDLQNDARRYVSSGYARIPFDDAE